MSLYQHRHYGYEKMYFLYLKYLKFLFWKILLFGYSPSFWKVNNFLEKQIMILGMSSTSTVRCITCLYYFSLREL